MTMTQKLLGHSWRIWAVAAIAVFALPVAASAATINMNPSFTDVAVVDPLDGTDGPFDVTDNSNIYRFASQRFDGFDAGGATFGFQFTSSVLPQTTTTNVTVNLLGEFTNLNIVWSSDNAISADDTVVNITQAGDLGIATQNFSFSQVPQFLIVTYDAVVNEGDLDIRVQAVPLPAGGLLLLTALGGVAALRRRRKAA